INVYITDNGLEAYLNIKPPGNGGAPPTLEALKKALESQGVSYNINMEKLNELAKEPIYNNNILIASGLAPVHGTDGTATFLINTEKKNLKPKVKEDGTVDYRDLGLVENVKQGQVLCKITLPTEGTAGITVQGKVLLPKKGRKVPSYAGKNTEFSKDGTAILAKIDGHAEFDGYKINVTDTFYIDGNVDNSTGNIKVSGNLIVHGMVLPGFIIESDKNINVDGVVDTATIKAGGNIKLQSGIIGSDIYCSGDLESKFIQNCNVFVKGNIKAGNILNSNVKCGKNLKVEGRIARIIGGSCIVGENIEAHTIGSVSYVKTRLELGTDPIIIERQQELLAQVPELEKQIKNLDPIVTLLSQLEARGRLTPEKKQVLDSIRIKYDTNKKLLEEARKELADIAQLIRNKGYGRIICTGTIYPGTTIVIGKLNLPVTSVLSNTSIYYKDGQICQGFAR
ncbi:MAG TPA: DUF342 domain-containing protein, partial [Clostridia bacterium]|nr:DUF342 domain-containing protein [Clostridia bacterium]